MNTRARFFSLAGTFLCLGCLTGSVEAQSASGPAIPASLLKGATSERLRSGYQEGRIEWISPSATLVIQWMASPGLNRPTAPTFGPGAAPNPLPEFQFDPASYFGEAILSGEQSLPLHMYPTACGVINDTTLLVGGVGQNGETVIQVMTMSWIAPMPEPRLASNGLLTVPVVNPSVGRDAIVYNAALAGRKYVRNITGLRVRGSATTKCLVQFDDSGDIYMMNVNGTQLVQLASATLAGTTLLGHIPELQTCAFGNISYGDRVGVGHTYIFGRTRGAYNPLPSSLPNILLFDLNNDGVPEANMLLSDTDYVSQGWSVLGSYANWWLR